MDEYGKKMEEELRTGSNEQVARGKYKNVCRLPGRTGIHIWPSLVVSLHCLRASWNDCADSSSLYSPLSRDVGSSSWSFLSISSSVISTFLSSPWLKTRTWKKQKYNTQNSASSCCVSVIQCQCMCYIKQIRVTAHRIFRLDIKK